MIFKIQSWGKSRFYFTKLLKFDKINIISISYLNAKILIPNAQNSFSFEFKILDFKIPWLELG